ncbi:CASP-like protein 5B3 [Lolium perenne]|uniref:CASP-like protein 5B3 n=1 Tax=Lolium perenne TaxID=4522 RepID=UPI0021F52B14|nr:CASP-like protein 5B3 [Lolium perenne]
MKLIVGSPGTWSSMALRVSQCVFAAASVCAMVTAFGYSNYTAFAYMSTALLLQFIWSLGLACVDIFCVRNKKDLHCPFIVTFIVIGDSIMTILVFGGASASASVTVLFTRDMHICRVYWRLACSQFALSTVLAFIVCSLDAASSFSGFWLLVSFF